MLRSYTLLLILFFAFLPRVGAQRMLTDMLDTTSDMGRGLISLYENYNQLRIGVYLQPQYQVISEEGARSYAGGDFGAKTDNRFMLRRGRMRADYVRLDNDHLPIVHFVFQTDATERGVVTRDCWGRVFENKLNLFSLTGGIFARPFGWEVNLSSSDRETPERGRMSQILMRTERDIGAMIRLEPRTKRWKLRWLRVDVGMFNGQGIPGTADYDSKKDLIARAYVKERKLKLLDARLSGGVSTYQGGIVSQSAVRYEIGDLKGLPAMVKDSAGGNVGYVTPRKYYGADAQLRIPNKKGSTEFRAEYIRGQQTATAATSETPGIYPLSGTNPAPLYTRTFDGAYFYYLQHLGHKNHQLLIKYDWYDPNTSVRGEQITAANGFTAADVRYNTLGVGYLWQFNPTVRAVVYYDRVWNEATGLTGFTGDVPDNVFTFRLHFRF